MKTFLIKLLTLILVVSTALCIGTACKQEGGDNNATHVHEFSKTVISPTCTEQGYTINKCSCGEEFKDNYVSTLNHDFKNYISDNNATCTVDGTKTATCENCIATDTITDVGSKLNHEFVNYVSDNNATESADGTKTATCERAGCNETNTIVDVGSKLEATGLTFKTLTVNELNVSGKVSNGTTKFNFNNELTVPTGYKVVVALSENGTNQVLTKEVDLVVGDNVVYVFLMKGDEIIKIYTVTIRRLPMCLVSFATGIDGVTIPSQTIEEGSLATKPDDLSISGYEFLGYDFDFNTPITQNVTINALWNLFTLNGGTITGLTNYGKTFSEIIIPESINGTVITSIGERAFYNCISITSIEIPNNVTSIGYEAFYNCDNLEKVYYLGDINGWVQISFSLSYSYNNDVYQNYSNPLCYARELYINNELVTSTNITSATKISDFAFLGYDKLISVTICDSVKSIGQGAFNNTGIYNSEDNLENGVLYIDNWLIEAKDTISGAYTIKEGTVSIADSAFYNCARLTSIEIPNSVTSIGNEAFYYCASITNIEIPNSVTSIGDYAFCYCDSLTSVTIGNSVTSIGYEAFNNTGIYNNEDNWENGVLYIGNCLIKAKNTISGSYAVKEGTVGIADGAFRGCSSLISIEIPNSVTSIGSLAFFACDRLTNITIDGNNTAYKSIDGVVYAKDGKTLICYPQGKTNTTFIIPNDVTTIGDSAFSRCYNLTSIIIPNSVTSIGFEAFRYSIRLLEVVNNSPYITVEKGSTANGYIGYYALEVVNSNDTYVNKFTTDSNGFVVYADGVDKILVGYVGNETNITIPNDITEINCFAFYNNDSITSVTICDGVESINHEAFYDCSNLTTVIMGNNVESIGDYAFCYCTSLTSIDIPSSVTSIGDYAFYYCTSLTSIEIPNSVISIGENAFAWCDSLTTVTIGNSVTSIGDYAFYYCTSLTSIEIPNSVTSIGENAFRDCDSLTSIEIPNSVTSIGDYAFRGCDNLTSITVESGNTAYKSIDGVLYSKDGTELICYPAGKTNTSFTITNSVTIIGSWAFANCDSLTSITYYGTKSEWNNISKGSFWANGVDATVYFTDGNISI